MTRGMFIIGAVLALVITECPTDEADDDIVGDDDSAGDDDVTGDDDTRGMTTR
jgi:hypothetical protein